MGADRAGVDGAERGHRHRAQPARRRRHRRHAAGVPVAVIAEHGRWAPASPVVLRYIRAVDRWRDNAMRNVGL
ncbi:hypothetical protein [Nonomuraea sp. bgisy101]|uniref:hypothetical protein n=1 Tax=Nonomuraea sp. bgisy101 TaxID=3413784 RepID=UPI003D720B6B